MPQIFTHMTRASCPAEGTGGRFAARRTFTPDETGRGGRPRRTSATRRARRLGAVSWRSRSRTPCCSRARRARWRPGARRSRSSASTSGCSAAPSPRSRCSEALWDPDDPRWCDLAAWLVYLSHFVVTVAVAFALWFGDLDRLPPLAAPGARHHASPASPPTWPTPRSRRGWRASGATCRARSASCRRSGTTSALHGRRRGVRAEQQGTRSRWARCRRCTRRAPFMVMLFFWSRAGWLAAPARRVHARDGGDARVHRRPLRVRHPARLGLRGRRLRPPRLTAPPLWRQQAPTTRVHDAKAMERWVRRR